MKGILEGLLLRIPLRSLFFGIGGYERALVRGSSSQSIHLRRLVEHSIVLQDLVDLLVANRFLRTCLHVGWQENFPGHHTSDDTHLYESSVHGRA